MSEEDLQALHAAELYGRDMTFDQIAKELQVSKSHAQTLTRRGLNLALEEMQKGGHSEPPKENPGGHPGGNNPDYTPPLHFPQDSRVGLYELKTSGISRHVMVTAMDIIVFDLFKDGGFTGDFSDFVHDSIQFMYDNVRPSERK